MRGTAIVLVCLITLHYLSVIDAYSVRFTSENGMVGREHEDKYPRRSTQIKRNPTLSTFRGLENETEIVVGPPDYDDDDDYYPPQTVNPEGPPDDDDDDDYYPPQTVEPEGPPDDDDDDDYYPPQTVNHVSKTLQQVMATTADALYRILQKFRPKPSTNTEKVYEDVYKKRDTLRILDKDKQMIVSYLLSLKNTGDKALDIASEVIGRIDVSELEQKEKDLKIQTLEMLRQVKKALKEIADSSSENVVPSLGPKSTKRRTRSVKRRTNNRDALEAYLTSLKSQKRSKLRKSLLGPTKKNAPMERLDPAVLPPDFIIKIDDCYRKMLLENLSDAGYQCVFLPLKEIFGSSGKARGSPVGTKSNVRSNKFRSHDTDMRKSKLPWGNNIFLIPIFDEPMPNENITTTTTFFPRITKDDWKFDNETTTTEPTTSTTEATTTSTTTTSSDTRASINDTWSRSGSEYNYGDTGTLLGDGLDDSRYRSKYDNDY